MKWFPVKSKRGPGRPKDKGLPKTPRLMATFLSNILEVAPAPKVITLKTEAGAHSEPIKIKIDMTKEGVIMPNGNGFLDPDVIDSCGFYIHVECCRWTSSVTPEVEMFKAERYLLKGLGQVNTKIRSFRFAIYSKSLFIFKNQLKAHLLIYESSSAFYVQFRRKY